MRRLFTLREPPPPLVKRAVGLVGVGLAVLGGDATLQVDRLEAAFGGARVAGRDDQVDAVRTVTGP